MDYQLTNSKRTIPVPNEHPHKKRVISSSGDLDGGRLILQHRNHPDDAWIEDKRVNEVAGVHFNGEFTHTARFFRVVLTGGTTPAVNLLVS